MSSKEKRSSKAKKLSSGKGRGAGRTHAERSSDTRDKVIQAAIRCIAKYGYRQATVTRIAALSGVSWGGIQHQFGNKAAIIQAVLDHTLDEFVMGVGTGGCFSGNAEVLKDRVPGVRCVATEPATSRALSGKGPLGGHRLEGMGAGFVPAICRLDLADEIISLTDEVAYETARQLARREGIFGGITSGGNVWAALQRARQLGRGHRVVTVIVDSGLKYLQGDLYQ